MNRIWARPLRKTKTEIKQFESWASTTENNLFDPEITMYPSTGCLVAYDKTSPLLYMPFQPTIMLESLAKKPGISDRQMAISLKEIMSQVVYSTYSSGIGEIYFLCKDKSTIDFAIKEGFEQIEWPLFRLKTSTLEEQPHAIPTTPPLEPKVS